MGSGKRPQPQVARVIRLRPDLSQAQAVQMDETLMIQPSFSTGVSVREQQDDAARVAGLQTLGDILDEELGPLAEGQYDQEVSKIALEVIEDGPRLQLDLDQWSRVQMLVESAIKAGVQAEQSGRL